MRVFTIIAAACAILAASLATAREQIPAEERYWGYSARIPGCEDPAVIDRVKARFASKEWQYWNSSLAIVSVDRIRTTAMRPNGLDLIPRRYCEGVATISNHKVAKIYYSVIEDSGIIGYTWGVHFCVDAYDRNWASAPECKMARP